MVTWAPAALTPTDSRSNTTSPLQIVEKTGLSTTRITGKGSVLVEY